MQKKIWNSLGDPFMGWLGATFAFTIVLHFFPDLGRSAIIIIIAFFVSDFLATWFIKNKEGKVNANVLGNKVEKKGHIFLLYYIGVIIASLIAAALSDYFVNGMIGSILGAWFIDFLIAAAVSFFVWIELEMKFYLRAQAKKG